MKTQLSLSDSSIEAAINQVKDYQKSLEDKTRKLRLRVSEELMQLCEEGFNGSVYDDIILEGARVPDVEVTANEEGKISVVAAIGKEAVFAEFGAGVYYNPGGSPNPLRPPGVVEIGTYGKGHGARKVWGFREDGELKLTHGTPASMPMYRAIQEIASRLPDIAREVFAEN